MAQPRSQQVSLDATPYYHCISRCVRRAFLCGLDPFTQQNYEYRRDLIEKRLYELADIFCIDLCSYAIMSNHYHCVLHIYQERAIKLSFDDVIERLCPWMDGSKAMQGANC
ncbi:MAG: hypothetical protein DSY80_03030 [Desulfocapsa sp.]|nr:MAG: hypothetical protein DSY80_03030 [Desulfocapsa sp.]